MSPRRGRIRASPAQAERRRAGQARAAPRKAARPKARPAARPARPAVPAGAVHASLPHDSARLHVTGEAVYVDDLPEPRDLLHVALVLSDRAHARITGLDTAAAARAPGVVAVLTGKDLEVNDIGAVDPGDPVLAAGEVLWAGQPVVAVAAATPEEARRAAALVKVAYQDLPAVLSIDQALEEGAFVLPSQELRRGDARAAIEGAPHRLTGRLRTGGQEHFYLEGQVAMALPREGGGLLVYASTQAPSEVQHLVAKVLGVAQGAVVVETRRMGGAFGGKESQAGLFACLAAILARRTGRPVKVRPDRDQDMVATGKRHDFRCDWEVGFDARGRILGLTLTLASRCGMSPDLSGAINDRAMLHADNAYFLPALTVVNHRCFTHTVSNTAFRGFGGPQGMMAIEAVLDEVARRLKLDPLEVRRANLYGGRGRDTTPYGQRVPDDLRGLLADLEARAGYQARRAEVDRFNARSPFLKRGLALTPVKFGISFTTTMLNQAGALVHVYTDGSVQVAHGGTEMGQGLFVKVGQVVADELGVPLSAVHLAATRTDKVPNASPTAASSGADMNGKAAQAAARSIKERMAAAVAAALGGRAREVVFAGGQVRVGKKAVSFAEAARLAHRARVSLSSTGYYRTPKITWDKKRKRGRPFLYFACGAAAAEVEIDTLTGEYQVRRVDVLHDVGDSLNPAVDLGQVEGGFVQGMGWLTSEELWWDAQGRLQTHAPSTYKIPTAGDVPADFRVELRRTPNPEPTVHRSKAVGEPPLMLAISVFHALRDAVAAAGAPGLAPRLDAPATPERVLLAVEELRQRLARGEGGG